MFAFQAQAHKLNANNTGLHVGNEARLTRIELNAARKIKAEERLQVKPCCFV